ncbi:MAG TPA: cellulase family glycosylhydrolase [Anaerolinea sp.]|nr:cellulase family glycosylhydrolase [Anaerolinea sp.]
MKRSILFKVVLVPILVILFAFGTNASGQTVPTNFVYLPIINREVTPSVFGAEISVGNPKAADIWSLAQADGFYWVRKNGLLWSAVQPNNKSEWNWLNVSKLETELALSGRSGNKTILVVRSTPLWAQKYPGHFCGPMKPENIADFADFMKETVKRYSASPYFIRYYELWNEPDVDHLGFPFDSMFGCWGESSDPYFGGGYYAQMLSQVYPAIKSVNPEAQVLIGGLLLDCDPTDLSSLTGCTTPASKVPPKFFEGILINNGGLYFDIANFHGYPARQDNTAVNPIVAEKTFSSWSARGGVVKGKIDFLREVMAKYGISKPIFQSETALMRVASYPNLAVFERYKADYLVWVFSRNMAENLLGTTWYTFDGPGWNYSGILDANQAPLPAYQAMKFAVSKLGGTVYLAPVSTYTGIEGFKFRSGAKQVWVLFPSGNTIPAAITLPAGYGAVYNTLGDPITPVNNTVTVDHPVYIEVSP